MVSTDSTTEGSERPFSAESHMTSLSPTPAYLQVAPALSESEPAYSSGEEVDMENAEAEDEEKIEEEEAEEEEVEDEDENEEEAEDEDENEEEAEDEDDDEEEAEEEEVEDEDENEEAEDEDDDEEAVAEIEDEEEEEAATEIEDEEGEIKEKGQVGPQGNEAVAVNPADSVANASGKFNAPDYTLSMMLEELKFQRRAVFQGLSQLPPLSGPKAETLKRKWLDVEILEIKAFIQRLAVLQEAYSLYLSDLKKRRDAH